MMGLENRAGDFRKFMQVFRSPALKQVFIWSKCIRGRVLAICLLNIIRVFFSLGLTLVIKGLIDAAVTSEWNALMRFGILLIILILSDTATGFFLSVIQTRASAVFQRRIQGELIQDIFSKQYPSIKKYHSGELINRVFSDAGVIHSGILGVLPDLISTIFGFVGAAVILITLDWKFVVLLLFAGLIGFVLVLLFRKPMKKRHLRMQKAEDRLHAVIQESFENFRLIKASVSERRIYHRIRGRQTALEEERVRQGVFSAVMRNSMGLMFDFSWLFCMLWGSVSIFRGELTYGSLAAMLQLIGRVQGPISQTVGIAGEVYGVAASAERLMELTELPSETDGDSLKDFDEISIEEVFFRYEDGEEDVLQNVSCVIHKGDFVALTGASGEGKTSLFYLLLGIYPPNKGRIVFRCGISETEACRGTRSLFAYVPQGNSLFSGTLRENLTLFTDEASDEEIVDALRIACIDSLVSEIGLDAELGERGVGISEGQAQRVAVARALLSKAPILLLDESTSALDEDTEASMLKNISNLRDKTCLIVTHRQAALSICDYRLHLTDGHLEKKVALSAGQEDV